MFHPIYSVPQDNFGVTPFIIGNTLNKITLTGGKKDFSTTQNFTMPLELTISEPLLNITVDCVNTYDVFGQIKILIYLGTIFVSGDKKITHGDVRIS